MVREELHNRTMSLSTGALSVIFSMVQANGELPSRLKQSQFDKAACSLTGAYHTTGKFSSTLTWSLQSLPPTL